LHDKTKQNGTVLGRGKFLKQITLDQDNNCGFMKTIPSYRKYDKFVIAMNSQMQSNKKWQVIEKPRAYKEVQVNEDIAPITPFNFMEEAKEAKELQHATKDDNQQKELWRRHLKLTHLSFPKI